MRGAGGPVIRKWPRRGLQAPKGPKQAPKGPSLEKEQESQVFLIDRALIGTTAIGVTPVRTRMTAALSAAYASSTSFCSRLEPDVALPWHLVQAIVIRDVLQLLFDQVIQPSLLVAAFLHKLLVVS